MRDEYDYKAEVGNEPLRYLRLPTPDNTPPTLDHLAQGAAFIKEELDKGGKVYIHCWEGLGRGPTMVAAYFVSTGISPADAWAKIRAVRPFVRPTPGQMQQLEAYGQHRKVSKRQKRKVPSLLSQTTVVLLMAKHSHLLCRDIL
jgi:protein-tyrosine phosphatase